MTGANRKLIRALLVASAIAATVTIAGTLLLVSTSVGRDSLHRPFCELVHASHVTVGPNWKLFATWHRPSQTVAGLITCHFGHEHGDDPRTSTVNASMPPFDYVNSLAGRSEAHAGFKVFVVNDNGRGGSFRIVVHQGSSSHNAFTENRHEMFVDYRNADGRELRVMLLGHFGPSGKFKAGCGDTRVVHVATATNDITEGERVIPDEECFAEGRLPYELWGASNSIRTRDGRILATVKPYFAVLDPNRFYSATSPDGVGRSDVQAVTGRNPRGPDSLYKGTRREILENIFRVSNKGGPTTVWTDVDGVVQPGPCPTCIKQFICSDRIDKGEPTIIFRTAENYDDGTVHAPN